MTGDTAELGEVRPGEEPSAEVAEKEASEGFAKGFEYLVKLIIKG